MSNILKTEAAQTKLLPAQTSTNEAQTNETIWGEFGVCGGGGGDFAEVFYGVLRTRTKLREQ